MLWIRAEPIGIPPSSLPSLASFSATLIPKSSWSCMSENALYACLSQRMLNKNLSTSYSRVDELQLVHRSAQLDARRMESRVKVIVMSVAVTSASKDPVYFWKVKLFPWRIADPTLSSELPRPHSLDARKPPELSMCLDPFSP